MYGIEKLPLKEEYLLSLINNNYSMHTVDNYRRDLEIFELFMYMRSKEFKDIDKLLINEYKGYLRTGQHLLDIDKMEKIEKEKLRKVSSELEEISKQEKSHENDEKVAEYLQKVDQIIDTKESSSKGSRNGKSSSTGLNSRSINRMLSGLRSFLSFLVDLDQEVSISPTAIKFIKTEKTEKQVADFEQLVELIEAPEIFETKRNVKYRNRAILEVLFSTGMRISELINLDRESIRIDSDGFTVLDPKLYVMGKGKKQRYVYLTHRAIDNLERYLKTRDDEYPALFIPYRGQRKGSPEDGMVRVSSRYVQSMIAKYKKKLGIVIPTTPHSLRHGFATYLAEKGANPAAIQRLLGHESLQTTTRYVHASDKYAEKSHREFHPLQD